MKLIRFVLTLVIYIILCGSFVLSTTEDGAGTQSASKIHYAVVIDAGSTGSRAFVFQMNETFHGEQSERDLSVFRGMKVEPGLSTFASNVNAAAEYILPALQDAATYIPPSCHSDVHVYIKGTAGMRLLPEQSQQLLWDALADGLNKLSENPFVIKRELLGAIDGHLEAYYAVLSANYIAGTIDANLKPVGSDMLGALDMGGSSTQLIFYTKDPNEAEKVTADDFWSHSWINFGVQKMRERVWNHLINGQGEDAQSDLIANPCTFKGHESVEEGVVLRGTGDAAHCEKLIRKVIWGDVSCEAGAPCPVDEIIHPPIKGHFYGMSVYFYGLDCIRELGPKALPSW